MGYLGVDAGYIIGVGGEQPQVISNAGTIATPGNTLFPSLSVRHGEVDVLFTLAGSDVSAAVWLDMLIREAMLLRTVVERRARGLATALATEAGEIVTETTPEGGAPTHLGVILTGGRLPPHDAGAYPNSCPECNPGIASRFRRATPAELADATAEDSAP